MSIEAILESVPEDKAAAFHRLHQTILAHLPDGFEAALSYGMLGYVVPHRIYPAGYHCRPGEPLPFVSIAAQKHSINLYHMGIYAEPDLLKWFQTQYPLHSVQKLDMGKSCIRFKKDIPFDLIGELIQKMTVKEWIDLYERKFRKA
jgi:hypothetical protein